MDLDIGEELEGSLFNGQLVEPWGSPEKMDDDDITNFFDSTFCPEDFVHQLPDDLEIPMFQDVLMSGPTDLVDDVSLDDAHSSDSSDSGVDLMRLKCEPQSPTSSMCSDSSLDSVILPTVPLSQQFSTLPNEGVRIVKQEIPDIIRLTTHTTTPSIHHQKNTYTTNSGLSVVKFDSSLIMTPPHTPTNATNIVNPSLNSPTGISTMQLGSVVNGNGNVVKVLMPAQSKESVTPVHTITSNPSRMVLAPNTQFKPKAVNLAGASKTLVLTPEEFAKLTTQKVLNIKNTSTTPVLSTVKKEPTSGSLSGIAYQKPVASVLTKPAGYMHQSNPDSTTKTIKRQQRMMKNRESACLSRKRKKEYLTTLEDKIQDYNLENKKLKEENCSLRETVNKLQEENDKLKKGPVKAPTIVLGVLLLLSLNLGPFMNIVRWSGQSDIRADPSSIHHGRTLLAVDSDSLFDTKNLDKEFQSVKHLMREDVGLGGSEWSARKTGLILAKQLEALTGPTTCPNLLNSTESQKLLNELRGWVRGHEEELKRSQEEQKKQKEQQEEKAKQRRPKKNQRKRARTEASASVAPIHVDVGQKEYGVKVFSSADQKYQNFLHSLQRRNDTFYVVSFRRDHLLLPATAHNKTMRPRMSVVMPAMGLNATMSPPAGSISMMQIDCEVTATRLVHIHKSVVPEYMDPNITQHGKNPPGGAGEEYYRDGLPSENWNGYHERSDSWK